MIIPCVIFVCIKVFFLLYRVTGGARMPVGIQMFATITSKDHYLSLQKDLQNLTSNTIYYDTTLYCCDGNLHYSRLLVGLIFPELNSIPSFTWMPDLSLLMPQFKRSEVEKMVGTLLAMQPRYPLPEESDIMNDWTDAIDTIIDNLQPESVSKDQSRTATLHSAVTKETAVLHAAQEEDTDAVLVVNEENTVEDHNISLNTSSENTRRNNGNQQPVLMQSPQATQQNFHHQQQHLHLQHQRQHHQPLHPQQSLQQQQHHQQQQHQQIPQATINHLPNVPNILQNLPGVTLHPAGVENSPKKQNFVSVNNEIQILPTPPRPQEIQVYQTPSNHTPPKPQEIQILPTPPPKPPTYVPIPSKNAKSKQKNAPPPPPPPRLNVPVRSPNTPIPRPAFVPVNSAVQILPKRPAFVPVRPRQPALIQPKKPPIRVEPKSKALPIKVRADSKPVDKNLTIPEVVQTKTVTTSTSIEQKQPEIQHVELQPMEIKAVEAKESDTKLSVPLSTPPKPTTPKPIRVFSCPVCHETFKAQDVMENHMKIHSDKHKCQTCGLVCTKARELIEHQRIHSGAKLVKCNICDKDFTEKGLRLHSDRFHKVEKKSPNKRASKENVCYMEDKITFTSSSESEPDEPEIISDEEDEEEDEPQVKKAKGRPTKMKRSELCEMCEKYFTKKGMKLHMARYHKDEDGAPKKQKKEKKKNPPLKKLFTCGFCEKKFSHLASMKVHEKVHLGGKPHQCDMCEAKFSNKFDLFAHEKTHSALRPHKCDECTETFKTAESLRFHKLIHVESQPNICRFCKKCFKNKNQLDLHERVHTGEKPFKCTQCDLCFETASKLTRHITGTHMS